MFEDLHEGDSSKGANMPTERNLRGINKVSQV